MKSIPKMAAAGFAVLVTVALAQGSARAQTGHEGHAMPAAAAAPQGVLVREATVSGYVLSYRLYTWDERNVMMKGMEGHQMHGMDSSGKSSHHLMLFAKGADGKEVSGGKVGFVVIGPDKAEFKTLTMAMTGGYGADVPLRAPGAHLIRTKAVFGGTTVTDEFAYAVK